MKSPFTGMFRSLRNVNYRIWFIGALISNSGTWIQRTAQDWLVLTELTKHDASALGWVMACQYGPQILLLPWTGSAADYFNKRKLLMVTQLTMGALSLLLGVLTLTGMITLWQVYIFAVLFGSAAAFDAPARHSFVGDVVNEEDLHNAVALNSTSFNSARMIGPAISGLIIAATNTGWAFVINGVSFFAVLVSLFFLRVSELNSGTDDKRVKGTFSEGLRYMWQRPDLKAILLMLLLVATFGLNFPIFISTMAVSEFHSSAQGYGLLMSFMAIGTVSGALLSARREKPRFTLLLSSAFAFGISCFLASLASNYWFFAAALVVTGISALTFTNSVTSLIQLSTERRMRGRMMALRVSIALGSSVVGGPLVGSVAHIFGPRWALGIGAASGFAAAFVALYVLYREKRRQTM
ncbi:MFS transporter [Marinomonas spartinae]|uniref:MFS transporter n=1 Tax=Marinomonas spartinae TaxID=1792290 RepID=UPI0018F11B76|nr:MFS transporter [Marinomonas spartinae]MBJ7554866.1 MFS transporter [Marinomonas spartinae]